jgi:two-component system, NarL family, nitrate/nitrite response regulator NarL
LAFCTDCRASRDLIWNRRVPEYRPCPSIRTLILSDVRLYREGLAQALGSHSGLVVVGTATSPDEAIRMATELLPSVILIDHALPDVLHAVRLLGAALVSARVVVLGVVESDQSVLACAEAGVAGYVPREASLEDLVDTIECASRGELRCSPQLGVTLLRQLALRATGADAAASRPPLTSREVEIVRLIEHGLSNKEIASRLGIQVATVKNHVHNLLEKLRIHRRAEAADRLRGRFAHATAGEPRAIREWGRRGRI